MKDKTIANRIADTVDLFPDLPILEVGPGTGILTDFLIEKNRPLTVVEVDSDSVNYLREHLPELADHIIEGDFLQIDFSKYFSTPFCIVGNYPYHISSQIFFKVVENRELVPCCSGMIQKEVADRLAASPCSRDYGIISVLLQAWYDVEYLFTVPPEVFLPPPKVYSAVVRLTRNQRHSLDCDEQLFKRVVKTVFNRRRKMLRNSIRPLLADGVPLPDDPLMTKRPEQLSVAEFIYLTNLVDR